MGKITAYKVNNLSKVDLRFYKDGDHFITPRSVGMLTNGKMKTLQSDLMTELNDLKNRVKALEEVRGGNLAYPIYDNYTPYGGSLTSTVIKKTSENVSRTYLVKVEQGQTYIATQKGVGLNVRYFWFENNPIENLDSEVSIGGGYHEQNTLNVPLTPPAGANWIFVVATINNDTHPVSEINFEKGNKATEELQFL